MDIKQLRICHPEPCVRDLKKTRMIEILRFAQKRSSPPEGAKGNDKVNGFFIILSCWNEVKHLKNAKERDFFGQSPQQHVSYRRNDKTPIFSSLPFSFPFSHFRLPHLVTLAPWHRGRRHRTVQLGRKHKR